MYARSPMVVLSTVSLPAFGRLCSAVCGVLPKTIVLSTTSLVVVSIIRSHHYFLGLAPTVLTCVSATASLTRLIWFYEVPF